MTQNEILIRSTLDGTMQPSLYYRSASAEKCPLLVGLHTWSFDRFNQIGNMLPMAEKYDFNLLLPEFRGSNLSSNPHCTQACASAYALQDVKDAIDWAVTEGGADPRYVFLLGLSGGGHMALMMAGFCPTVFTAVGAYVPITDLAKWTKQKESYAPHVFACCSDSEEEMAKRSPMTYIDTIAQANVKIFHGKYDPVVPVSQSVELYEAVTAKYPRSRVFLDVFDGGHQIDMEQAMYWLLSQYKKTKKTEITG